MICRSIDHMNVLPLLAVCIEPNCIIILFLICILFFTCLDIGFVYENIEHGNIPTLLCQERIPISLYRRLEIARDIASGMAYLSHHTDESARIHTNFKSNNIFLTSDWTVKIGGIYFILLL
jgi:hypothetical protein